MTIIRADARKGWKLAAPGLLALAASGGALAFATMSQAAMPTSIGHAHHLLIDDLTPRSAAPLTVTSPTFTTGSDIPLDATQYGRNEFPGLAWSRGPAGTKSYVVVMQGALSEGTSIHFVLYDIPAKVRSLAEGMASAPAGAAFGPNVHGTEAPYAGPHVKDGARREYHVQVFALDTVIPKAASLSFDGMRQAMQGHVLASGQITGFASPPAAAAPVAVAAGKMAEDVPVQVDTGLLTGIAGRDPEIAVYKGIPYAKPPVGELRWKPPVKPEPWTGVRKAAQFGPACPQPGGMAGDMPQSEDCLTLNVWTGAEPNSGEKRPVYVWIYGGGFIGGTGADPQFDGEGLAKKGVVVVTLNYRVGVLGFLSTPELSRESGHNASGNYGLMDDIAALQWVKRNIAAFGGDPDKVTIGGQSAGAGSVGFLTMSPLAKGLFRAGIVESHARYPRDTELRYLSVSYRKLDAAQKAGEKYAAAHGARTLAQLRAMPWQELIKGSNTVDAAIETGSTGKPPLFRPVVDGWVLPHNYWDTYHLHGQNPVTVVAGNNKDESGAVPETDFAIRRASTVKPRAGMPQTSVTLKAYVAAAHRKFGPLAGEFLKLYPASNDDEAALQNNASVRDNSRISTWLWGGLFSQGTPKPIFTYFWTHAQPGPSHDTRGAFHGSEIPYAFDSLDAVNLPWTPEDRKIADVMSTYWANIIKDGNPNGPGQPEWPQFSAGKPQVMELGDHFGPIPIASPEKIAFWKRFFATQPAW